MNKINTQTFTTGSGHLYCTVVTDIEQSLIMDTWTGQFGTQENFINVLRYVANQIKEQKIKKWLANIQGMVGVFDKSMPELNEKIMPSVIRAGLIQEAIVMPTQLFATLSTKDAMAKIKNLEVKKCGSLEEAKSWLNVNASLPINNEITA